MKTFSRRRFLANLGIGAAALMLRFRPESVRDVREVYSDEFGGNHYTVMRAWVPINQPRNWRPNWERLTVEKGSPADVNYFGHIEWRTP